MPLGEKAPTGPTLNTGLMIHEKNILNVRAQKIRSQKNLKKKLNMNKQIIKSSKMYESI